MIKRKKIILIPKITNSASKEKSVISLNQWNSIELINKKDDIHSISTIKFKIKSQGHWKIKEETCRICWKNLGSEPAFRCPNCLAPFHQGHWEKWIQQKHACPMCRIKIEK